MNTFAIDIRTVVLVLSVIFLCRAALLGYAWAINRTYLPIRYWAIGSLLAGLGVLFLGLRGAIPLVVSVVFGQAGLIFGWMIITAGTITATERIPPWRWGFSIATAGVAGALVFVLVWPDESLRTIAVSLPGLLFDSYCVYICLRFTGGRGRTATFRVLAVLLSISVVSSLLKNLYLLQSGSSFMVDANARNTQFYILSVVILVACTVLYFLLAEQKSQELLAHEVERRKTMEDEVRQLAFHDSLTGLPNRRVLQDRLNQAMAASKRSGCCCALIFLDLDNFKLLNDTQGHRAGDLLLIEVARRLTGSVREVDTVSRFGGDEFAVLLSELTADKDESTRMVAVIAEKIRIRLAEPYMLAVRREGNAVSTVEHRCSASIGVVVFINHECSQEDILRRADTAMYQAKDAGRNVVVLHEADVEPAALSSVG